MGKAAQGGFSRVAEIADELSRELSAGLYPIGSRFLTEQTLRERFQVGRHSVREALKVLTEQGCLGRRRKTGTFVLSNSPVASYVHSLRDLHGLLDFAENTSLRIAHMGTISTGKYTPPDLAGLPDRRWLRIAGLRTQRKDGAPVCWSEILLPERFAPPREQIVNSATGIYEATMRYNGLRLEYVEQEISAVLLPDAMYDILKVAKPEGETAGLLVKRRYVAHTGEIFEISQNLYPAGRTAIRTVIRQRA